MTPKSVSLNRSLLLAILTTALMVLYAQFILGHFSSCFTIDGAINSLGLYFGYSTEEVLAFFEARSEQQLICYTSFLKIWDLLFPIVYTSMYISWIIYFLKEWTYFSTIPILHMIADWLENFSEIALVNEYLETGEISNQLVSVSSGLTIAKWTLSILTYGVILYAIIYKLKNYITLHKSH